MARLPRPLTNAVRKTIRALNLGPADSALVALALEIAASIDAMPADVKARMLGQTSGALARVLGLLERKGLRHAAQPSTPARPFSTRDELKRRRDEREARRAAAQ